VSLVPTSAISGEGINDLLHMLTRLSQTKLATHLSYSQNIQCTILEVKVIEGLGCTVDVILVNGVIDNGATIVVCTTEGPVVTQVRVINIFCYLLFWLLCLVSTCCCMNGYIYYVSNLLSLYTYIYTIIICIDSCLVDPST